MNLTNLHLSDISIPCLIKWVLRHIWMVIAAAVIMAMSVSVYYGQLRTPVYQSTMTYAVTARQTSAMGNTNANAANQVAAVLTEMLVSPSVRKDIAASDPKLANFSGTISSSQIKGTNFVVISVRDSSPERAFLALQAVTDLFPTLIDYVSSNSISHVIQNPRVSTSPINAVNVRRNSLMAAALGAGAMVVLLCLLSVTRETVQTRSGARRKLDAHIIASVERERRRRPLTQLFKKDKRPLHVFAPTTSFAYTEQINTICSWMEHESAANGSRIFMIAGVGENEGKSTISGNVAAALAMMGKKVALVDADLRNPTLNRFFGGKYNAALPLNQMLAKPFSRENLLHCMYLHPTLKFYLLCAKGADKRCSELLSGQTMDSLLQQLKVYDYVLMDTPPMGYFAEAEMLSQKVDASMLVVRQDLTPAPDINDAIDLLRSSRSRFLGCILNDMTPSFTEGYGYGQEQKHYGYGYGYGYREKTRRGASRQKR